MSPTIRDVARLAGVSVATASRVLSDSGYPVAPEVRQRVLDAARELDFTPNAFARGLSKRESRLIGLVIPNIREPYFLEIGRGTEEVASRHGYLVVLCNTDRDPAREQTYLEQLRALRAGVILVGRSSYDEAFRQELESHPAPIVVIGRHQLPCSSVQADNVQGAIEAVSHLVQLGRRRIAFIGGPLSSSSAVDRLEGYREAMRRHGLPVDESLVVESDYTMEGGARALLRLLRAIPLPDALFAANDQMAIGAMREARGRGLRVPADISIVGFNDIPVAAFVEPPLTTVRLPLHRIGEVAADLLLRQLQSREWERTKVVLTGELVVRGSTAPGFDRDGRVVRPENPRGPGD